MTRKAPTGPKHDRCIDHVEHPYPAKGILCIGETIGRAGMIEFADEMAARAAAHRAAFEAEPVTLLADGSHARMIAENVTYNDRDNLCTGEPCRSSALVHAHRGAPGSHVWRDDTGLSDLVARYRDMRGLDVQTVAPIAAPIARKATIRPDVRAALAAYIDRYGADAAIAQLTAAVAA